MNIHEDREGENNEADGQKCHFVMPAPNFKPYHPAENNSRSDFIDAIKEAGHDTGDFIVQEKVHGANLTFVTDGAHIYCAKRTGWLNPEEKFFNYQSVRDKYQSEILEAYKLVKKKVPDMDYLYIFGELFGGHYPHPEVRKNTSAIKLQAGISYSPNNDFYAFDLRVHNHSYLDLDFSNEIFTALGLLHAETLYRGGLEDCLSYSNEFITTIPARLGLPAIAGNTAEGIIIKPVTTKFLPNKNRVILKNKNPLYEERIPQKTKIKRPKPRLSSSARDLQDKAAEYINQNRLNSAISKLGELDLNDPNARSKLIGFTAQDALADFIKDHATTYNSLEKEDQKQLRQWVSLQVAKLLN